MAPESAQDVPIYATNWKTSKALNECMPANMRTMVSKELINAYTKNQSNSKRYYISYSTLPINPVKDNYVPWHIISSDNAVMASRAAIKARPLAR